MMKTLEDVAEQYRSEGYEVVTHPEKNLLPAFASGFDVDILATKNCEHVIVEVKENRAALQADVQLPRLAEITNAQPQWRLDLVVLGTCTDMDRVPEGAEEPSAERILGDLDRAERIAQAGDVAPAFLMAWGSLEAAMRQAARSAGINSKAQSPTSLASALYSTGLLDKDEFDKVDSGIKVRNAAVHGLALPEFDRALFSYLTCLARKLVSNQVAQQNA